MKESVILANSSVDIGAVLLKAAHEAKQNSYSPYSKFAVGAAVLCKDGTIFTGCNIENASFGLTNCAERVAIQTAVAAGYKEFQGIAIVGDSKGPCMPCGACRQVLVEFKIPLIYCETETGDSITYTLEDILPYSFGPEDL